MDLPKVQQTDFLERLGVLAVETAVVAARCIWRETLMRDVGIDGQIEYVTPEGQATGRIVLVQVKSGVNYFNRATPTHVAYSPSERHRNYWGHAPLPVVLCLHNPDTRESIWVDARREIQEDRAHPIRVPRSQVLDSGGVHSALASHAGPLPVGPVGPETLLSMMRSRRTLNAAFDMSFFDIFVHGLTHICHSLYFGMDLVTEIAEARLELRVSPLGMGIGFTEYEFLDEYVAFVVAHDLVRFDYDWYARSLQEMEMVAKLLGPLTPRGRQLVEYISRLDMDRSVERGMWDQVVVERFVEMVYRPGEVVRRVAWIEAFEASLDSATSSEME